MEGHSIIPKSAKIDPTVKIGSFVVIEERVEIGAYTEIANFVVIKKGTKIGSHVKIEDHAVLGKQPKLGVMSTASREPLPDLVVEKEAIIGAFALIHAGSRVGRGAIVADCASIRERVTIGELSVIGRGVCVENDVQVGKKTRIQTGAYITAYSTLEDYVFIAPMVTTTNDNFMGRTEKRLSLMKGAIIKKGARVGGNSILLPGVVVGEDSFVAAGSIVTRDVPPKKLVMGIPAKIIRDIEEEELLEKQSFFEEGSN